MTIAFAVTLVCPALDRLATFLETVMPTALDVLNQIQQQQQLLSGHVQGLHDAAETTVSDLSELKGQIGTLTQQVGDLTALLAQGGQITPDVQAKADEVAKGLADADTLVRGATAALQAAIGPAAPAPTGTPTGPPGT